MLELQRKSDKWAMRLYIFGQKVKRKSAAA